MGCVHPGGKSEGGGGVMVNPIAGRGLSYDSSTTPDTLNADTITTVANGSLIRRLMKWWANSGGRWPDVIYTGDEWVDQSLPGGALTETMVMRISV